MNSTVYSNDKHNISNAVIIDIGTVLEKSDIVDYENFIKDLLGAEQVIHKGTGSYKNRTLQRLIVMGDIGKIAISRLQSRSSGFTLMWEEDAINNGYMEVDQFDMSR